MSSISTSSSLSSSTSSASQRPAASTSSAPRRIVPAAGAPSTTFWVNLKTRAIFKTYLAASKDSGMDGVRGFGAIGPACNFAVQRAGGEPRTISYISLKDGKVLTTVEAALDDAGEHGIFVYQGGDQGLYECVMKAVRN
ncbi:hypothetical protein B0H14DRAFT_3506273 [Mycena olivaceomarginata]|nr:hypothetical protein B0H14DRAFT_3506273 [Mycena olivaceomarginata]